MKKQLTILSIVVFIISIGFSGCLESDNVYQLQITNHYNGDVDATIWVRIWTQDYWESGESYDSISPVFNYSIIEKVYQDRTKTIDIDIPDVSIGGVWVIVKAINENGNSDSCGYKSDNLSTDDKWNIYGTGNTFDVVC